MAIKRVSFQDILVPVQPYWNVSHCRFYCTKGCWRSPASQQLLQVGALPATQPTVSEHRRHHRNILVLLSILTAFFRWIWVNRCQNVSILYFIGAKNDGCGSDDCSYKTCKAPVNRHHPQTNTQFFTGRMPFLSPN